MSMSHNEIHQIILKSPLAKAVGAAVANEIISAAVIRQWPEGAMIFQEGDPAEGIFILGKGTVKLTRFSADGRENVLTFLEAPSLFAEAAIFIGRYPATAIAITDTELLLVPRAQVMDLIRRHESFLNFLFGTMARWMQRLVSKIEQLTLNDATARVARYILSELEKSPPQFSYRVPRITLPAKKGDLATLLNISQPTLSRIFRKLQDDSIIEVQARTIYLSNLEALRNLTLPPLD